MASRTVSFNGSDLASSVPGLIITACLPNRFPDRALTTAALANADKSVTLGAYYRGKKINVSGEIGMSSRALLDDSIDLLYSILQAQEATLIADLGSSTRQWTATMSAITITDQKGGHCAVDIEFTCSTPFGTDANSTTLFSSSLTGSSSNTPFALIPGGTAYWQQPVITITLSALTGGTTATVTIGNPSNGQQVSIVRTWTAGDVIVIDSRTGQKKVTVNGTEVAFTGSIPEWRSGVAGSMDYSDTLTTRTRAMSGLYYKRYV